MTTVEIVVPRADLHASWLAARAEFGAEVMHGSGDWHAADVDLADPGAFAGWLELLRAQEDHATPVPDGRVHATYRWLLEDDGYAGCFTVRHALTPWLLEQSGHLGYSVRPAARRRGYAGLMTRAALRLAGDLGLDRILVTADEDNVASWRTIESAGGVHEDTRAGVRRYWIVVP